MNIDFYERIWMWAAAVIIAMFIAVIGVSALPMALHPPSHVETIDPAKVFTDPRFSKIGQPVLPDGTIEVQMAASCSRSRRPKCACPLAAGSGSA